MSGTKVTKATLSQRIRGLIAGTQKHAPNGSLTLGSATYTAATLVQTLKSLADALDAADSAKASWKDALKNLTDARAKVGPFVGDYQSWVLVTYRGTPSMLADFGVTPPKARTPLTADEKACAAVKAKATRVARHTMGSKQRGDRMNQKALTKRFRSLVAATMPMCSVAILGACGSEAPLHAPIATGGGLDCGIMQHARTAAALARRYGGVAVAPRVESRPVRGLEAMALENAVEGWAREAFGALVAMWQATVARDPVIRAAMTRIARDETRHAALALEVDAWLHPRLDSVARARVDRARRDALEELAIASPELPPSLRTPLGLPSRAQSQAVAKAMERLAA